MAVRPPTCMLSVKHGGAVVVIFENGQWLVTSEELKPRSPSESYPIDTERLDETTKRGDEKFYDWPLHMAEKTWVDVHQFNEAFEVAIRHAARGEEINLDEDMLERSLAYAVESRDIRALGQPF